jgi:hypothetical protein
MTDENWTKLTVNLTPKSATALGTAALISEDTRTDVVNRALQLYTFLLAEQAEGKRLALVDEDGNLSWVRIIDA